MSVTDAIERYVAFVERRPVRVLVFATVLAAAGVASIGRIDLDPSLEGLLPPDTDSRRAVDEARERVASSSPLYLLVASSDAALNRRLSSRLLERVLEWPDTRWAINQRDPEYFLQRRLLFAPVEALDSLTEQVEETNRYHQCAANPACINLEDEPPRPDFEGLRSDDVPELGALAELFGVSSLPEPTESSDARTDIETGSLGDLCSTEGDVCAVQVVLDGNPSDLTHATEVHDRALALLDEVRPEHAPDDLRLATSGRYRNAPLTKTAVERDLRRIGVLSLVLVLLVLLVRFRGARALVVLTLPIVFGAAWTIGVVAWLHPTLNLLSAFTLAVLAGVGIDFGIHLLACYGAHRGSHAPDRAVRLTLHELGRSMFVAALTTGCGFAALVASDFRGFAEMGWVAAVGVGLTLVATLVLFPPLVLLGHRLMPEQRSLLRPLPIDALRPRSRRVARVVAFSGLLLAVGAAWIGSHVQLETNFRNIGPQNLGHGIAWSRALHGTNRTAVTMLASDPEALEDAARSLRETESGFDGTPLALITPRSFVPPEQPRRLRAIRRLHDAVRAVRVHADDDLRRDIDRWSSLLVESPIVPDELPEWVRQSFAERDGSLDTIGVMYTSLSGADANDMQRLSERMAEWRARHPEIVFASGVALLGEVLPSLRNDAPVIMGLALLGLLLATLAVGRSVRRTALAVAPLVLAMACTTCLVVALDGRINLYNLLVFPLAFGMGVDGSIYLLWAHDRDRSSLNVSGGAVLVSTLTTMAAFGSLCIASDRGLQSLGVLALIALGSTLVANLVWLLALLRVVDVDRHTAAS